MSGEASGPDKVLLLGMMGSGKSVVGRILAKQMGVRFVDLDRMVRSQGELYGDILVAAGTETVRLPPQALHRGVDLLVGELNDRPEPVECRAK